nr:reverse transcriptase domain-containing protein [Tanacetum cinerariifolium]
MTTPNITSSADSQIHNNIMAAGSKDRPPMLAPGRYPQWCSRFLRYVDIRPNGEALRKCILSEQANKITWTELKRLLTNKYCPELRSRRWKMKDEFYDLTVKGNDLKTYIKRFHELATLCPNMVPNTEKLIEAFIDGLPRSIKGNVTASKPQTLEEAINIA